MYDTGDWNKKIHWTDACDLVYDKFEGWDKINDNPIRVDIYYKYRNGEDKQHEIICWADDNSEGYFQSDIFYTEGGTPVVHYSEKIGLCIIFQKATDAIAFKLRWLE